MAAPGPATTGRPRNILFRRVAPQLRLIAAGGLNPDNVAEAIRTLTPWGVDVATGVEAAPGRKDPARVAAFIRNAREAFARLKNPPRPRKRDAIPDQRYLGQRQIACRP